MIITAKITLSKIPLVLEANNMINKKTNKSPLKIIPPKYIGKIFLSIIKEEIITNTENPINWLKGIGCTPGIVNRYQRSYEAKLECEKRNIDEIRDYSSDWRINKQFNLKLLKLFFC